MQQQSQPMQAKKMMKMQKGKKGKKMGATKVVANNPSFEKVQKSINKTMGK